MSIGSGLKDLRDWLADPRGITEAIESQRRVQNLRDSILEKEIAGLPIIVKPDGSPFPHHMSILKIGDMVPIRGQTFKVAYVGETSVLLEPMGPLDFTFEGKIKDDVDEMFMKFGKKDDDD